MPNVPILPNHKPVQAQHRLLLTFSRRNLLSFFPHSLTPLLRPLPQDVASMSHPQSSPAAKLRARLAEIEQQIAALASQMTLLRTEWDTVSGDLATIIYPVLMLPNEITSDIFLHYVDDHPRHSPLRLAGVCRSWRAIALSTCRLWDRPKYWGGFPNTFHLSNLLQCWLPRAGSLLLDLDIRLPASPSQESDAILRILGQHSSQWRSLELTSHGPITFPADVRGPFSSLTKLSVETYPTSDGPTTIPALLDARCLRKLRLENILMVDWQISIPWAQLTTLELLFYSIDECLEFLAHTPNLEVLLVSSETLGSPPDPVTSPPCYLPRLHTFRVGSEPSSDILPYLILPSLDHLSIWLENDADLLERLVGRSGCPLRKLALFLCYMEFTPMHDCIMSMPSVRDLTLTCPGGTNGSLSALFSMMAEDPFILPALESLMIDDCQVHIDLCPLVQMLAARAGDEGMEGAAKLTSFKLTFDAADLREDAEIWARPEVEAALDRLRGLRSQGAACGRSLYGQVARWDYRFEDGELLFDLT